jgi:MFS family permease
MLTGGEGESAIPEDKKEEILENSEDDWAHDPVNPRNWPFGKKWSAIAIVSLYTFVSPLGSSMMAPALPEIGQKYGITNPTILAMTLSIFLISFAFGPLLLAPLSEMYGRTWVLHIGNLIYLAFNLGCAFAPTAGSLIAFRFLAGWAGAAPIAIGGGSVSDVFSERERAGAMALYSLGPLIGPVVGPIAGGFIAQSIGIKYVFIVISASCGVAALIGIPLLRETYAPVIRLRLAQKSADPEKAARQHPTLVAARRSKGHILWVNLSRPAIMLTHSFICFILSLYMALMYGIYYLMFTTFPNLFSNIYHFSTGVGGLAYIGLGIGFISATIFGAKIADKIYTTLADKNGGKGTPEMRIPALIFGSFFVPAGLFWYGWSAQARLHWIMPMIGSGIFGFGLMTTFLPIQLYLVDAFSYAASALAAAAVFRSLLGFAFPLFGEQMYHKLGNGGGNSLLAGLAIVIGIPFPIWIWFKGEDIRKRSSLAR